MPVELCPPTPDHVPQLAQIFFDAFKGIAAAHNFPHDVPSGDVAMGLMHMLVHRPDFYGVVAVDTGVQGAANARVRGFNFLQKSDEVGGVGPLCVAPGHQQAGLGRLLMRDVLDHALAHHGPMVRLLQEGYNMTSLSLYASMGYEVREPIVLMSVPPGETEEESVRPLTAGDLDAAAALCGEIYRVSRRNELAALITNGAQFGCVPFGRFTAGGELVAYIVPGFFGHAVARSAEILLPLVQEAARQSPPNLHRLLVPTRTPLFAAALARGFRAIKPLALMTIGPYESPRGAWVPSIGF